MYIGIEVIVLFLYRVTIQLVTNLPLTSKQKFCFGLLDQAMPGQNGIFVLKSTGSLELPAVSPCTDWDQTTIDLKSIAKISN